MSRAISSGFAGRAKQTIERYALDRGPYAAVGERMDAILARMDAVGGEPSDVARAIEIFQRQTHQQLQRRRLSGAVCAEKPEDLSFVDRKREAVQRAHFAFAKKTDLVVLR